MKKARLARFPSVLTQVSGSRPKKSAFLPVFLMLLLLGAVAWVIWYFSS